MSDLSIGQFLRLIWPKSGHYCIAHPFKLPDGTTTHYNKVFPTISEAVTHCHEMVNVDDVFFGVLSLNKPEVINYAKVDYKTQQPGKRETRVASNILAAKAVFWDIDVGPEAAKYTTRDDALRALAEFLQVTRLPIPTIVSSGGGLHVYWPFAEDVPVAEWRVIAWHMRLLAEGLKLRIDPRCTTDTARILRVTATFNWKDRSNPRPVKTLDAGAGETPVASFRQLLQDALIRAGVPITDAPQPKVVQPGGADHGLGEQTFNDFGPKPTLAEVAAACGQVAEIIRSHGDPNHPHYGALDNTAWYQGMLSTIRHVEDGETWCRKLTAMHPRSVSDIDQKLKQLEPFGPAKCETLQQFMPWKDSPCQTCRFRNKVPNPLVAARKATTAPPPSADPVAPPPPPSALNLASSPVNSSPVLAASQIPNPPKPWERLKAGGIAITKTDKDGNSTTSVIYPNDLYPLKRLVNRDDGTEQQVWRVYLPRTGAKDFVIDADVLYDARKFCVAISNNGIYPNKADISALQDYMVAYITQLQKVLDGESQHNHLGWADDFNQFVLPDKVLLADGTTRVAALTKAAQRAAQHLNKRGTLAEQVRLMGFFNHPEYIPNQFAILCSIGSILLHATGQHGVVVNCSGEPGASKSTTLSAAMSLWGDPVLGLINGTNRGATANARAQQMMTFANLPTCVDEITHIPVKDAQDMVMNISQPGHRLRLQTDGTMRAHGDHYKASIMISTANNSLHALLSSDSAASTAAAMRVFEMKFVAQKVHTKADADEFLRQLKQNYGHIGEIIAHFAVTNRALVDKAVQDAVRRVDAMASIQSSERFSSAVVAAAIVGGEIAKALRLLPYDPEEVLQWAVHKQLPYARGVVKEEYRGPLAILSDYIAEKNGSIVVVDKSTSIGANTAGQHVVGETAYALNTPHGALLGHYDIKSGVLYLLKQGFKTHCNQVGASSSRIIEELSQPRAIGIEPPTRIVVDKQCRRTLGAGTPMAKGQAWCFAVNMNHPEMSGVVPMVPVSGGTPTSAPAGQLKAV